MNLEEVKKFIEQNKESDEVKTYLQELSTLTVEGMEKFVEGNEEAKRWLDSVKDKHLTKGIETFKQKSMPKLIDEEIKKRFPNKDPKDVQLEEIKAELEKIQNEKVRESLTNLAMKIANERKLPLDLVEYFISNDNDQEKTKANLQRFEEVFNNHLKLSVEERLKTGYTPPTDDTKKTGITKEQFKQMGYHERVKLASDNPELYKKLSQDQ